MNLPLNAFCGKEIQGNEEIYVKMRYPERKGMTEIKAYLQNEGKSFVKSASKIGGIKLNESIEGASFE